MSSVTTWEGRSPVGVTKLIWGHDWPFCVAWTVPSEVVMAFGGARRFLPATDCANGMPLNESTFWDVLPT